MRQYFIPLGILLAIALMQPVFADKSFVFDSSNYNQTITVHQGETINWQNSDPKAHTITSGDPVTGPSGMFDSGLMPFGKQYSFKFTEAGLYHAYCMLHPEEQLTIQVLLQGDEPQIPPVVEEPVIEIPVIETPAEQTNQTETIPQTNQTSGEIITNSTVTIPNENAGLGNDTIGVQAGTNETINALTIQVHELQAENQLLRDKITNLKAIILEQIHVMVEQLGIPLD